MICLEKEIEVQETQIKNIDSFIQKSGQYVGIEELTSYTLHELVKAIYVDAPDKSSGKRVYTDRITQTARPFSATVPLF